ncbi:hypothetical protein ANO11243_080590 [Dothideomycetidae sp. 11243]|nr:hypothetical protein ANO11243_080590 [fungal sp. No.11243]
MGVPTEAKREFFIFGHNIAHSLSPALHNAGFRELNLPHRYRIHESADVDASVESLVNQADFGGASVTFPHKLQIGRLLDAITPCAERVGAVNTVMVRDAEDGGRRVLVGDNTDWVGIKRCIERSRPTSLGESAGLVLGAGGAARAACYAMQMLGVAEVLVVNRTVANGEAMVARFPGLRSRVFGSFDKMLDAEDMLPVRVIVACVPADDLGEDKIPAALFSGSATGALVEMAYRPQITGMMKRAAQCPGWSISRGVDVLEEQAYEQFRKWTGMDAPESVMREAMQAKAKANM